MKAEAGRTDEKIFEPAGLLTGIEVSHAQRRTRDQISPPRPPYNEWVAQHRLSGIAALVIFLFASSVGVWSCNGAQDGRTAEFSTSTPEELLVKVVPARTQEWVVSVTITGSLHSLAIVTVKSEVGGKLLATHFEEGDRVRKDQLLAEIDPGNYRLACDQANAGLSVAQAGLAHAQVILEHARREEGRAENLLRTGGITEKDHQAAITAVREAEAKVAVGEAQCRQALASIATAEKALRDCRIMAPADGHIYRKDFDRGSLVAPGSPLYTLVDNSRLELECLVPSHRLSEIRLGQRAQFNTPTWGERNFDGVVSAVNPMVENDNRSVKVFLRTANPKWELRSGMFARGAIETRREPRALVIPRSSLIPERESSSAAVYIVEGTRARRRMIRVGGLDRDIVWVQTGLSDGDMVIVEIGPSLKDGTPVRTPANSSEVME